MKELDLRMQSESVKKLQEELLSFHKGEEERPETSVERGLTSPPALEGKCEIWTGATYADRRPRKTLTHKRSIVATRWVYMERHGLTAEDIKGYMILSVCGNRLCVNAKHLYLTKNKPSNFKNGSGNFNSKLTAEIVTAIRHEYRRSYGQGANNDGNSRELMDKYGISRTHLSKIVNRNTWAHVV